VYPATGIPDELFPNERRKDPFALVTTPALQLLYPFRTLAAGMFGSRRNKHMEIGK
jgi:hypothetical protein